MDIEEIEVSILLEAIHQRWGHDFRQYAKASLYRRIRSCLEDCGLKNISEMVPHIIHDRKFFDSFLNGLTVNVTEFFRDPDFFKILRRDVIPYLNTFHHIKIWSVGVSTGQEIYSLAILLKEEDIYEKCLLYATDFNDSVLDIARRGIYQAQDIQASTRNYLKAGGKKSFTDYVHADYESVAISNSLKKNIVFANHNIATDSVFGEMNLVLCRNVLIYFNNDLQNTALQLFDKSLTSNGFLCLGPKESINFSEIKGSYSAVSEKLRIFQKKR